MFDERIQNIPLGYSQVMYHGKKYGLSRVDYNARQNIKIYAEELGGKDFVSFNFYPNLRKARIKPCEMALQKVEDFLENYQPVSQ